MIFMKLTIAVTLVLSAEYAMTAEAGDHAKVRSNSDRNSGKPELTMVLVSGNKRVAVIGGKAYELGEKLGRYIITDISLSAVEACDGTKKVVYKLKKRAK